MKLQRRFPATRLVSVALALLTAAGASPAGAQGWLVLPFANQSGEASLDWLGDGFAISLEEMLRAAGHFTIPYETARGIVSEWGVPGGHMMTLASALKAGDHAGAERVVIGVFRLSDGELWVEAQVLDPVEMAVHGEARESARLGDLFDLHRRLSRAILRAGSEGLLSQQAVRDSAPAPPLAAYEQYVRALVQRQPEERLKALRQAAHAFPVYPLLQYRLAEELHEAGRNEDALACLERVADVRFALSPEARLLRAEVLLERGEASAAAAAAGSALDLRDSYRARLLRAEALLAAGSREEARADLERARQLGAPAEDCEPLASRLGAADPPAP